ncbi:hypothetical protein EDM52_13815 [Brevibacillus invocatus]|uniref:Uncharacterized protein n=1 Tax=Brevibacillus invocatus TaxID=173959 RepID=A0A3M8C9F2_9BACL|nr:hypothetical protein [Brevibacillus invocatus]RNB72229.1 hypothetical protein EDM52_13815 [Brevibacillus invocatus]
MTRPEQSGKEQPEPEMDLVRRYILFGLLFRVVMADMTSVHRVSLKLSYDGFFQELSRWSERQHHAIRRLLRQRGCYVVSTQKQGHTYVVQYRQRGYLREAIYSIEILRAECQELIGLWMTGYQQGEGTT